MKTYDELILLIIDYLVKGEKPNKVVNTINSIADTGVKHNLSVCGLNYPVNEESLLDIAKLISFLFSLRSSPFFKKKITKNLVEMINMINVINRYLDNHINEYDLETAIISFNKNFNEEWNAILNQLMYALAMHSCDDQSKNKVINACDFTKKKVYDYWYWLFMER